MYVFSVTLLESEDWLVKKRFIDSFESGWDWSEPMPEPEEPKQSEAEGWLAPLAQVSRNIELTTAQLEVLVMFWTSLPEDEQPFNTERFTLNEKMTQSQQKFHEILNDRLWPGGYSVRLGLAERPATPWDYARILTTAEVQHVRLCYRSEGVFANMRNLEPYTTTARQNQIIWHRVATQADQWHLEYYSPVLAQRDIVEVKVDVAEQTLQTYLEKATWQHRQFSDETMQVGAELFAMRFDAYFAAIGHPEVMFARLVTILFEDAEWELLRITFLADDLKAIFKQKFDEQIVLDQYDAFMDYRWLLEMAEAGRKDAVVEANFQDVI